MTSGPVRRYTQDESKHRLPTLVMPVDRIKESFDADAGTEAALFLELIAGNDPAETG